MATANSATSNVKLSAETAENIYTTMRRIRAFEEKTMDLFEQGAVKGTAHSYIGEEAIASAVGAILRPDDYMASNHRGHGHCIAKGADLQRMMAELMGRDTGYCRGLGGSMHIADLKLNILGANGIMEEYDVMRHLMNMETVSTYEGTHEIHTLAIGSDVTGFDAFR